MLSNDTWSGATGFVFVMIVVISIISAVLIATARWAGHYGNVQGVAVSSTNTVRVQKITEFDGVNLYRVDVDGRSVYVAKSAEKTRTSWDETVGKITTSQNVETIR